MERNFHTAVLHVSWRTSCLTLEKRILIERCKMGFSYQKKREVCFQNYAGFARQN